jgi:RNA polymerase sigma-70 factor (ECF subfamily)
MANPASHAPSTTSASADAATLMGRYVDGDAQALRELYRQCAPRLLSHLITMVRDRATAEDVLQQTFVKVHHTRARYIRGADPIPWLSSIAHRTCLDELRRRRRSRIRLATTDAPLPEPVVELTGSPPDADLGMPEHTFASCVRAISALPAAQRRAIELTKLEGRSTAEAAAIEGTTVGNLRVRVHRGYLALRTLLATASQDPAAGQAG